MHIAVCIKQVPDTAHVRINPETNTLIREGVESIINPFDENALECALKIKDENGAKVTAISMGPPQAEVALRECLGRGADEVMHLCDVAFAGSDTWATSYVLSKAVQKLNPQPDMILFGKQAIDGDTAQVGPGVAEFLDWPVVTYVRKIDCGEDAVKVERVFEDGYEKVEAEMPCVLTILKEANIPRMASLRGRMKAKKADIHRWSAAELECEDGKMGLPGSPTRVMCIFSPPKKTGGVKIDGALPLDAARAAVTKLQERGVL